MRNISWIDENRGPESEVVKLGRTNPRTISAMIAFRYALAPWRL
jgi:hypothetical protein